MDKFQECEPMYCTVCGEVIERKRGVTPSAYRKRKYHASRPDCVRLGRSSAGRKAAITARLHGNSVGRHKVNGPVHPANEPAKQKPKPKREVKVEVKPLTWQEKRDSKALGWGDCYA